MSIPIEIFYIFGYILKISNGKSLSENFWCFHDFYNLTYWVMSILIQRFYIFGYILKKNFWCFQDWPKYLIQVRTHDEKTKGSDVIKKLKAISKTF